MPRALGFGADAIRYRSGRLCTSRARVNWLVAVQSAGTRPKQIGIAGTIDGVPVRKFESRPAGDLDGQALSNHIPEGESAKDEVISWERRSPERLLGPIGRLAVPGVKG